MTVLPFVLVIFEKRELQLKMQKNPPAKLSQWILTNPMIVQIAQLNCKLKSFLIRIICAIFSIKGQRQVCADISIETRNSSKASLARQKRAARDTG